jgi:prolyl-tRNA synthetase
MRYSQLFGKTTKTVAADAESVNAQLLTQGGFITKQMAGVYNYLPLGLRVLTKIQTIIREELNIVGAQEILMPALTLEENYSTTGREGMDVLFHLNIEGGAKAVLNPTHEEVVTPLVKTFTFSYRDLPRAVYQIQNKFRNEPRAKSGLLRGREFNMKDLYSFHTSEKNSTGQWGLEDYYEKMKEVYFKIYERLGLHRETVVLTYASGGAFSRYSHEFQALCDVGEDTIYLCPKCKTAINKEIFDEMIGCPNEECLNTKDNLVEQKAIEIGNIFKLHTRFSEAFKCTYKDAEGKDQLVEMGCYGMGPSRIMGTLVELFHDDKGIIWPASVAPYHIYLIALGKEEETYREAEKIYQRLIEQGREVLFDDRRDVAAGEKFADADLIGIPNRVVVSKKTLEKQAVEVKKRTASDTALVSVDEFIANL